MTLRDAFDRHTDPSGRTHLAADAEDALHPLVGACLWLIAACVVIGLIGWLALPAGEPELAPATGTTVQP